MCFPFSHPLPPPPRGGCTTKKVGVSGTSLRHAREWRPRPSAFGGGPPGLAGHPPTRAAPTSWLALWSRASHTKMALSREQVPGCFRDLVP